jgi:hypothetical protein
MSKYLRDEVSPEECRDEVEREDRVTEITRQMLAQDERLERLKENIEKMETELKPILLENNGLKDEVPAIPSCTTPLGLKLEDSNLRLDILIEKVRNITTRIEL